MGKTKTAKAARTRAENIEREQQDGIHLAAETKGKQPKLPATWIDRNWTMDLGGRAAKHRALQNAGKLGCLHNELSTESDVPYSVEQYRAADRSVQPPVHQQLTS